MKLITIALFTFSWINVEAQSDTIKSYTTARVSGEVPQIDGVLTDPAWDQVPWGGGDFIQLQPDAGAQPTVQTKFKILYDAKNLYIAFKCYDPEPDKIVSRMSRRDGFEGDFVEINIDSYFDKRTAFSFTSSVSGVKGDEYVSNNGDNWDANWDPIWYLKTSIDSDGWVAELRIPLSQLRFADKPEHTWGFQIMRRFFRNQERSIWKYIPPSAGGWVHLFGELRGITGIKPQKQLEVQPYVVAKTETFEKEDGNPFATGKSSNLQLGLDAKIGLTSDITLDLTVNPDFGQVEADPSQVNLTAFELFFQERRPFFIEGNNTLNFPVSQNSNNNLFYSRRIGRSPQSFVDPDADKNGNYADDGVREYVKVDARTTILGAAKLTGKNKNGFSWGVLESVTGKEYETIDSLGHRRKELVEPLTNYFVTRAQKDINKGNTIVGAIFTATNRQLKDYPQLNWLHNEAYSGGIDFYHNWSQRKYYVSGRGLVSHVRGSTEAIANTQLSSERYFQRPDNNHTRFDSTRTSLTGTGGQFMIGKKSGKLVSDFGVTWQSPELELNDIGFLSQTDNISQWFWMQYRILNPKGITRSQRYNINQWRDFDFGMKSLAEGYNVNAHWEFKNFWQTGVGITHQVRNASNADLRGGPTIHYPGSMYYWMYVNTDSRKKLFVSLNPEIGKGSKDYSSSLFLGLDLVYKPINALNISISPSINKNKNQMQYVDTFQPGGGENKYVVAEIDNTTVRVVFRVTYMFTPNLSLQYYGQPFGSTGTYAKYKLVTDADASEYNKRFETIPDNTLTLNGSTYEVDQDNDGAVDYSFRKRDFGYGQFRSNMVIRWEYIPGSTFFLVWTQERNGAFTNDGSERFYNRYQFDFSDQKAHNVFVLKFTYRFVR
jgi:hypothetical protein